CGSCRCSGGRCGKPPELTRFTDLNAARRAATDRDRLKTAKGGPPARPSRIGVPRFELGTSPTRTERATRLRHTPRTGNRLARLREREHGAGADVRALSDQEMAAIGNEAEGRVQPARVLEAVDDRHQPVARAPEDEHGTADPVEVLARVVRGQREPG